MVGNSPGLFAASHVLLRLRLPRHPPCALRSLVTSSSPRPPHSRRPFLHPDTHMSGSNMTASAPSDGAGHVSVRVGQCLYFHFRGRSSEPKPLLLFCLLSSSLVKERRPRRWFSEAWSSSRLWWSRSGSNRRFPACKAGALPAELRPRALSSPRARRWAPLPLHPSYPSPRRAVVGLERFELSTPRLSSVCSNQLSYRPSSRPAPTRIFKEPPPVLQNETARAPPTTG